MENLAWVRTEGDPEGVGICLSGGGVRAAAFALGAIQQLQAERGLLYGPSAARYLVGVSGGAYTAAASTINADALRKADQDGPPPLAPGSPEEKHILGHGRYLFSRTQTWGMLMFAELGNFLQILTMFLINLMALPILLLWVGFIAGAASWLVARYGLPLVTAAPIHQMPPWVGVTAVAVAACGFWVIGRGLYLDSLRRGRRLKAAGLGLLVLAGAIAVGRVEQYPLLSQWAAWWWRPLAGVVVIVIAGVVLFWGALFLPGASRKQRQAVARWVVLVSVWTIRIAGAVLVCLAVTQGYRWMKTAATGDMAATILILVILLIGLFMGYVTVRVSPHRWNRKQISSAFAIEREQGHVNCLDPTETPLSGLAPPVAGSSHSFPQLLISATVNIRHKYAGNADTKPAVRGFAPFVFSHDRCGIPDIPGASFDTTVLERGRVPSGALPRGTQPLLTLMSAVACTGAAASPAMGRFEDKIPPAVRTILMLLNIRLGTWLPNPLSSIMRADITAQTGDWDLSQHQGLGGGYDEFVPELLALHRSDAARAYISDGGHYDNLGLTTLIRARCATIWCVDSQADKSGKATQLRQVTELVRELGVEIVGMDPTHFVGSNGILKNCHAIATIRYPGTDKVGTLVVIKLGMAAGEKYQDLKKYQERDDHSFPFHGTFTRMAFGPERMDAYCALGRLNASAAVAAWSDERQQGAAEPFVQTPGTTTSTSLPGHPPAGVNTVLH
jgi:hypothetical protein